MGLKLNIQEFINDYCGGVKDKDILAKHNINAKELIAIARKLINEGLITKDQYFERNRRIQELEAQQEKQFLQSLFHCQVCGHIHPAPFTVCPACGTAVDQHNQEETTARATTTPEPPPTAAPHTTPTASFRAVEDKPPSVTAITEPVDFPYELKQELDMTLQNVVALPETREDLNASDYVLTEILSNGSWAAVFKAEDLSGFGSTLAVKQFHRGVLPDNLYDEFLDKIITYQSGMNCSNIVKIKGTADLSGKRVILYEFMPSDLQAVLNKEPEGINLDFFNRILPQILDAVGYSHMHRSKDGEVRRIPHLHLRMSKLLFDEQSRVVKLDDCGVWKALVEVRGYRKKLWEESEADASALAPECFVQDSKFVNGYFADIYGLGVALYRLTTGRSPFVASTVEEYHFAHLRTFPIPPRVHRYTLPSWLDGMILKCLEKEPARRWRSATQMELSIGRDFVE